MQEIMINHIPVKFPFTPYQVQKDYMHKVIDCLQLGQNGVLESPTGTGKTLCLLCSTLAWLEIKKAEYKSNLQALGQAATEGLLNQELNEAGRAWQRSSGYPKIIYASRTHSQLSQAISELKKTSYSYLKVSILGSRDQMCIHPQVSKEASNSAKVSMCQVRVKSKNCYFHNQVDSHKDDPTLKNTVMDLEDLVAYGRKKTFCPYYMSRDIRQDADIIFLPYNYLLDPKTRKAHGIELQGNVIIFDEAHNVEKMCEEYASLQLRSTDLAMGLDDVTQVLKKVEEALDSEFGSVDSSALPNDFNVEELCILKGIFQKLEETLSSYEPETKHGGLFMHEFLSAAEVYPNKKVILLELLDKLVLYLTTNYSSSFQKKGAGLKKFSEVLQVAFSKDSFNDSYEAFIDKCYKVYISEEQIKTQKDGWSIQKQLPGKTAKVLSYWCFNPGFGMKDLVDQNVKCLLLTSGTLSPIECFTTELQVPFPVQLENPHIIDSSQVFVGVVSYGPDNSELNSSFKNRSTSTYMKSLGQTIVNFSRIVPGGLLVFFPSYPIMKACHEFWMSSGIWNTLINIKPVFMEPQTKQNFTAIMDEFYAKIRDPTVKGACFMAVCRGKVSEGLDFADNNGRAVIITGLPYPPMKDQRVILKKEYLEKSRLDNKKGLTGHNWYRLEASRAVNQAIGRVIRHKDDYGAILLCDRRFGDASFKTELSAWVRPYMKVYKEKQFGVALRDVRNFFIPLKQKFPDSISAEKLPIKIEYEEANHREASAFQPTTSRRIVEHPQIKVESKPLEDLYKIADMAPAFKRKCASPSKLDLFSSLNTPSSVINFNKNLNPYSNQSVDHVKVAKKKIKIISESEKSLRDFLNVTKPTSQEQPKITTKSDNIAEYIKQVKSALSKEDYSIFSEVVKTYQKTKDLQVIFNKLFPLLYEEHLRQKFLKRFSSFLRDEHKRAFNDKYQELFNS